MYRYIKTKYLKVKELFRTRNGDRISTSSFEIFENVNYGDLPKLEKEGITIPFEIRLYVFLKGLEGEKKILNFIICFIEIFITAWVIGYVWNAVFLAVFRAYELIN